MLKHWIATIIVGAALVGAKASPANADGKNEIRAVSFDDDAGTTRIHVRGAQTPTFTVYKLERPSRVVIDLPQARLADVLRGHESASVITPSTWAVSTIAAQQLDDGGQVVRVIITLARPGRYDVKTDGNEVVVMVTARDTAPKTASPEALAKAQAEGEQAKKDAAAAQADAAHAKEAASAAQVEAERLRKAAADQVAKAEAAQRAADETRKKTSAASAAEIDQAKQAATAAQAEAMRAKADAAKANELAMAAQTEAKTAAARAKAEAEQMKQDAAKELARAKQEAEAAKQAAALAQKSAADATTKARADAELAKHEAEAAKQDAVKVRAEAAAEKRVAEADKQKAEVARQEAEKLMRDAKSELATLDKKTAAAQQMEDKARAAHAAALAREEAAREAAQHAAAERLAAEDAAKRAAAARDQSSSQAKSERDRLAAEAHAAELRLADARKATADAESRRAAAEAAQARAKQELETSKSALATVEQQRSTTENAAAEAARKRAEAEAAARDASRRRTEAEVAATEAMKKRGEAETAASMATKQKSEAEAQRQVAEQQRQLAETAARTANESKQKAEASLATLTAKREAAEKAAQDVETRSKAEAKAQAELAAATARKATDAELARARTETERLATQRKIAEAELADRRKAVAAQQAEADRLKVAAVAAHDAAQREEARRTQLAEQRVAEEKALATVVAQKKAVVAVAPEPAPVAKPSVAAVKLGANAKISDITFRGADLSGDVTIALAGNANVELGEVTATHVELIVDHAELGAKLERTLDVSKFGSPIKTISSFRDRRTPDRVRLVAELTTPATPTLDRDAKAIRWHFAGSAQVAKKQAPAAQAIGGFGAASTPVAQQSVSQVPGRRHVYHGQTVSYDIKDAPIHDLLRLIAETGHINIVVPDTIDAKVTVKLNRVPWDQALEVILSSHGLWYRRDGNLYRVATRKEIDTEDKEEAERRAAAVAAESPRPEVLPLNYASANELKQRLESMLSPKGHIEVEDRTNALIVNDVTGNREQIARLALQLDTQTPQISIEARIVEARSTFVREFGIQWGGRALSGANTGNATGLNFPSSVGLVGANTDANTIATGVAAPSDFAINLPAATGSGEGGAIGLSLGSVSGNFNINLRLSALEDSGTIRIISAPKITVLNNKEAKISQGVSIPISVVSAAGAQTQFVQADLALTVKPYVSQRDCAIAMDLVVTKNEPDFVNTGARGDPSILTKTAKTSMLVLDGETSVLGGIYTRNTGLAYQKVPFLADLPVIGWLFKHRKENDDRTEILVFVTPKITNKGLLHCQ